jgi:hypothetical protein
MRFWLARYASCEPKESARLEQVNKRGIEDGWMDVMDVRMTSEEIRITISDC